MSNNTFLRNKKTRIAFILALTLLLQVFMPIMKVEAKNYEVTESRDLNLILYPGDVISTSYHNNIYEFIYSTINRDKIFLQNGNSYTIPENTYYIGYGPTDGHGLGLCRAYKITLIYNGETDEKREYLIGTTASRNKYQYLVPFESTDFSSSITGLPTPTRDGYTFDGWYTEEEGGTQVTNSTTFTARNNDTTLYAHWTPDHIHVFTYSVGTGDEANKITATCTNTESDCPLDDGNGNRTINLTIAKPALATYGGTESEAATLTNLDAFKTATGLTIANTDIKYAGRDGTIYDESTTPPTAVGKYTASITLSNVSVSGGGTGNVKASVDYEIAKRELTINQSAQHQAVSKSGAVQRAEYH